MDSGVTKDLEKMTITEFIDALNSQNKNEQLNDKKENELNTEPTLKDKKFDLKVNVTKYIALIRMISTIKMMKEDNIPIEIVDDIFIGSVGAANNKQALIENKITHIVVAATGLKTYFPNVNFI
jgi:hypothetical protein